MIEKKGVEEVWENLKRGVEGSVNKRVVKSKKNWGKRIGGIGIVRGGKEE